MITEDYIAVFLSTELGCGNELPHIFVPLVGIGTTLI